MVVAGKVGAALKSAVLYVPRKVAVGYHAYALNRSSAQMAKEDALRSHEWTAAAMKRLGVALVAVKCQDVEQGPFAITADAAPAQDQALYFGENKAAPQRVRWSARLSNVLAVLNTGSWYMDGLPGTIINGLRALYHKITGK